MSEAEATLKNTDKDATKLYLREVSRNKLLNHAQEIELSQTIENAKKALLAQLFEVPMAVDLFVEQVSAAQHNPKNMEKIFNAEGAELAELTKRLEDILESVVALKANPSQEQATALSETMAALPFKLSFYDQISQAFLSVTRELTKIQGEFYRAAQASGVGREAFLACHKSGGSDPKWQRFETGHEATVAQFRQAMSAVVESTGLDSDQLSDRIQRIRTQQRIKDQAVETMLKSNLRLVVSVAKRYSNISQTPILDLIQEGNIGLLKAIEKFNWRLGFRFSTYATWWIKQCVLKALNEQHRIIRIPSHMTDLAKRVIRAREEHVSHYGFEPSIEEIAAKLEVDAGQVEKVYTVAQGTISLETPIGTEEDQTIASLIEDHEGHNPFNRLAEIDTNHSVADVLAELTPKEERVIRMRFGIGVSDECTLEDIGQRFGVTRERIRQIEAKALLKLKSPELGSRLQAAFE